MVVFRFYNIYGDKFVLTFWRNMLLPLSVRLKSAEVEATKNGKEICQSYRMVARPISPSLSIALIGQNPYNLPT